jgi:hypothetical protein
VPLRSLAVRAGHAPFVPLRSLAVRAGHAPFVPLRSLAVRAGHAPFVPLRSRVVRAVRAASVTCSPRRSRAAPAALVTPCPRRFGRAPVPRRSRAVRVTQGTTQLPQPSFSAARAGFLRGDRGGRRAVVHHAVRVGFWVVTCGARHAVGNHVLRLGWPVRQGGGSRTRNRCEGPRRRHDDGYRTRSATVRCRRPRNRSQRPRKPSPCDSGVADERAAHTQVGSVRCERRPCAGRLPKSMRGGRQDACGRGCQRACVAAVKKRAREAVKGAGGTAELAGRLSRRAAGCRERVGAVVKRVTGGRRECVGRPPGVQDGGLEVAGSDQMTGSPSGTVGKWPSKSTAE